MSSPPLLALAALAALALRQGEIRPLPSGSTPLGLPARASPESGAEPEELVALGARLFFDPVLSSDRSIACASCHRPELGFADAAPLSRGVHGRRTTRNTPTLLNRAYGQSFMWDGRAASLEEQALLPIENPLEMDLPLEEALARLGADAAYRAEFELALGGPPGREGLARALAAYVRTLVLGNSPVDRFRAGRFEALSDSERAGLWLYESRGGCWRCHGGANFSDEGFHNTGVGVREGAPEEGRAAVSGRPEDRGRFKTPTLRGLAATAPYMHDGSLATLEDAVEFYRRGGGANPGLDPLLAPIEMSSSDAANLAAFLRALSAR
jgi:cytochrome c peroxidase